MALRKALKETRKQLEEKYYLIWWEDTCQVSVANCMSVEGRDVEVGQKCKVTAGGSVYDGSVAAAGKEREMEYLVEQFERGEYRPFGFSPPPPPSIPSVSQSDSPPPTSPPPAKQRTIVMDDLPPPAKRGNTKKKGQKQNIIAVTDHGGKANAYTPHQSAKTTSSVGTQTQGDLLLKKLDTIEKTQKVILDRLAVLEKSTSANESQQATESPYESSITYNPFTMLRLTPPQYSPSPPPLPSPIPPLTNKNMFRPCPLKPLKKPALPSSAIDTSSLINVTDVISQNSDLRTESGCGTLAQRLAKRAIFGEPVMRQCTPTGSKRFPALPRAELFTLKQTIFQELTKFHDRPGFESLWDKKCMVSIEQSCNRLRKQ